MIRFKVLIEKYVKKGEKSGWTFISIPASLAQKLKPGNKKSFRVKGRLDGYSFNGASLLPVGKGDFILPFNATMRKATHKQAGHTIEVQMAADTAGFVFDPDLMACLNDDPPALRHFRTLPGSHQRYFSKWISSAKTNSTKAKRIVRALKYLAMQKGFAEMLRDKEPS